MSVIPNYENNTLRSVSAPDLAVFKRGRLFGQALLSAATQEKHGQTESEQHQSPPKVRIPKTVRIRPVNVNIRPMGMRKSRLIVSSGSSKENVQRNGAKQNGDGQCFGALPPAVVQARRLRRE